MSIFEGRNLPDRYDRAAQENARLRKIAMTKEIEAENERLRGASVDGDTFIENGFTERLKQLGIPVKDVSKGDHI